MKKFKQLRESLSTKRLLRKEKELNLKLKELKVRAALRAEKEFEKEDTEVKEGTWDIPDTKTKLQKLMDLVSKPYFATTEKEVDKYLKLMPFGDDELYDDLGVLYFIPGSTKSKKFPKTDLNQVAMDSLNGRWLTAKKKGNGWDITHINFDVDMDETIKRKSGNMKPGRRMKVDFKQYNEGIKTMNDGGAWHALRIAKYLSDQDGNPRWSRVPYGTSKSYLDTGMAMLKKDPKKAKEILSKPTPRSGSL